MLTAAAFSRNVVAHMGLAITVIALSSCGTPAEERGRDSVPTTSAVTSAEPAPIEESTTPTPSEPEGDAGDFAQPLAEEPAFAGNASFELTDDENYSYEFSFTVSTSELESDISTARPGETMASAEATLDIGIVNTTSGRTAPSPGVPFIGELAVRSVWSTDSPICSGQDPLGSPLTDAPKSPCGVSLVSYPLIDEIRHEEVLPDGELRNFDPLAPRTLGIGVEQSTYVSGRTGQIVPEDEFDELRRAWSDGPLGYVLVDDGGHRVPGSCVVAGRQAYLGSPGSPDVIWQSDRLLPC